MTNEEKEELLKKLKIELEWIKYRIKMLDRIEEKLYQMKGIAIDARDNKIKEAEKKEMNEKLKKLQEDINAIEEESKKN